MAMDDLLKLYESEAFKKELDELMKSLQDIDELIGEFNVDDLLKELDAFDIDNFINEFSDAV